MQEFNISELHPHPRNSEFFDDITGGKWDELLDSIRQRVSEGKRGNIEPIIITQDKTIVSGHQRVRAFQELGIPTIEAEVKIYSNDDEVLRDLLESNIRRRGEVGGSAKKVGLRIKELERLYGIKNGNNQHERVPNKSEGSKSQEQLAAELEMSVDTLRNYKLLADMIPELDELVTTGIVTKTTALAIMKELSPAEQEEFVSQLDVTERITQRQAQEYIAEIKHLKEQRNEYNQLYTEYQKKVSELQILRTQVDAEKKASPEYQYQQKLKDSALIFVSRVYTFMEQIGGLEWVKKEINQLPKTQRNAYVRAIQTVKAWADIMDYDLNMIIKED